MAAPELIIDADSHITEPPDVWTARVPAKYREDVPHVVRQGTADTWVLHGERLAPVGVTAPAGWPTFPPEYPQTYEDCHPGAYQADARLKYMDEAGIWAQVLYPNVGGFGSENFLKLKDDTLKLLCVSAYNDFLVEWSSADLRRLLPVIATPFWDIDETVREIERCAPLGARGILFTGEPQRYGLPVLGSPHWNPLWEVARAADLPIHFHIGSAGDTLELSTPERYAQHGVEGAQAYCAVSLFMKNGVQCSDLITSGVLSRYPELKFVSVESGIGWLPFMLEATDYSWLGAFRPGRERQSGDVLPSDLFRQSVFVTYWFESVAPKHFLDLMPIDNILFETDFPHTTCLFQNIQETITSGLGHVDGGARRKILWENATKLYRIEEPSASWRATAGTS
ncbi:MULTISPECIES: amidohydrolase family protein [unclassified Parafrankia]|uniref:amidohydrolase family protein n=1 Tax=Parafrankia TaxID=2994362 RepID=UPI000DA4B1ED|nr:MULTISPECIES: amidohydrolase family protein [unclassified Parafrankia]TCJ31971.1 amidohydrolase [Parafrankia sp. BMG5.11]CAI7974805.1 Amidohydrolase [Frankia sp. Hr75.2]SQE00489.1 Amidohydrolase 2 [Parafrankia sp. Ea1.12]